jgi:hypothetical protein
VDSRIGVRTARAVPAAQLPRAMPYYVYDATFDTNPIPELEEAAKLLDAAATAIVRGQKHLASELIGKANIPEIMVYAKKL